MGFFLKPLVVCSTLLFIAAFIEILYLRKKYEWLDKIKCISIISVLVFTSVMAFSYFFSETPLDIIMIIGIITVNLAMMHYTIRILNSNMPLQYTQFFLIHLVVGVLFTGLKQYILIEYPGLFFALLMSFSCIYYIYRTDYKFKVRIIVLVSALIVFRIAFGYSIDFSKMDVYKDDSIFISTYESRPVKVAVTYLLKKDPTASIKSILVLDSNPRKGITIFILFRGKKINDRIKLFYLDGEITEFKPPA